MVVVAVLVVDIGVVLAAVAGLVPGSVVGLVGLGPGLVGLGPGLVGLGPGLVGLGPGLVGLGPGLVGLVPDSVVGSGLGSGPVSVVGSELGSGPGSVLGAGLVDIEAFSLLLFIITAVTVIPTIVRTKKATTRMSAMLNFLLVAFRFVIVSPSFILLPAITAIRQPQVSVETLSTLCNDFLRQLLSDIILADRVGEDTFEMYQR